MGNFMGLMGILGLFFIFLIIGNYVYKVEHAEVNKENIQKRNLK